MSWIDDLGDYYRHNADIPEVRIIKLFERFSGYDSDTLASAVDMYIEDNEYFPTIANFKPYAVTAAHLANTKVIRRVHRHTDNEMYEWELARGSMHPLPVIEAKIAEARIQLKQLKEMVT